MIFIGIIILILPLLIVCGCYAIVELNARGKVYNNTTDIPHNRVGLVLGTNPVISSGKTNYYFKHRIDAAAQLFKAGKVDYLLVSGDNHTSSYDEPTAMRDALMAQGVPESRIVLDYAGFRTLDSIIRAHEVFGQSSFTVISQPFHNKRSICIGSLNNIEVIGYNAQDVVRRKAWYKQLLRESLSRVNMFIDHLRGKQPHFLGEKIEI